MSDKQVSQSIIDADWFAALHSIVRDANGEMLAAAVLDSSTTEREWLLEAIKAWLFRAANPTHYARRCKRRWLHD
jgi:hypothetical protein